MQYQKRRCASVIIILTCCRIFSDGNDSSMAIHESPQATSSPTVPSGSWRQGTPPGDPATNTMRGNWLKKLKYFRRAELVYKGNEEAIEAFEKVEKKFRDRYRAELDAQGATLKKLGIQENDLRHIESHYHELMVPGKTDSYITAWSSIDFQTVFAKIYDAFKDFATLGKAMESALSTAAQEMNIAKSYSEASWQKYVAIDTTYNDVTAKVLLDEMQAMHDHVNDMMAHVAQSLEAYCSQRSALMKEQVSIIESLANDLRKHQFPVTLDEFNKIKEVVEKLQEQTVANKSIWSRIGEIIAYPFVWIWHRLF